VKSWREARLNEYIDEAFLARLLLSSLILFEYHSSASAFFVFTPTKHKKLSAVSDLKGSSMEKDVRASTF